MSIIKLSHLADAVLSYIQWINNAEYIVEPYQNGREHGWALTSEDGKRKAVFSEYRNTDEIVVYTSGCTYFDINNIPNEETYDAKTFFHYDEAEKAARFIIDYLNKIN